MTKMGYWDIKLIGNFWGNRSSINKETYKVVKIIDTVYEIPNPSVVVDIQTHLTQEYKTNLSRFSGARTNSSRPNPVTGTPPPPSTSN